jgi:transposase-like protein
MHELSAGNATTGTTHEVAMGLPAPTPQSVGDAPPHATPFPQELAPQRLDEYRCALVAEFQPVGPSERVLVEKLAQLMAASDCWAAGEFATAREALRVAPTLLPPAATSEDAHWARAMNCDGTERCSRQFLGHVKGLQGTIKLLCDLQAQRRQRDAVPARPGPQLFNSESKCRDFLLQRYLSGAQACTACGAARGYYVPSRAVWECAQCGRQCSLRAGTVMARSGLPLVKWFNAVGRLIWHPTCTATELAAALGIRRVATVRTMMRRIWLALSSPDRSELLAGLDAHFGGPVSSARPSPYSAEASASVHESRPDPRSHHGAAS